MEVVERVISLGSWCMTKGRINTYFSPERPITKTKSGHADIFDWMFIHDYTLLANALWYKLNDLFEVQDLEIVPGGDNSFFNRKYNMTWNHLFDSGHISFEGDQGTASSQDDFITVNYSLFKPKIDYLINKFHEAKHFQTLYIITPHYNDPPKGHTFPTLEQLISVRDALTFVREGDNRFYLLYVTDRPEFDGVDNILVRQSPLTGDNWNDADPVRWREIFNEFQFSPTIWE